MTRANLIKTVMKLDAATMAIGLKNIGKAATQGFEDIGFIAKSVFEGDAISSSVYNASQVCDHVINEPYPTLTSDQ